MTLSRSNVASLASTRREIFTLHIPMRSRARITNILLLVTGLGLLGLSRQLVVEYHHFHIGFSGVSGWSATLYLFAVFLVLTQPTDRFSVPIILGIALLCRIPPLVAEPYLSSDIYRYVWDGIVQHAHVSPYRYVPGDTALAFLRPAHQAIFDHINRRDYAHTIYPPLAQMLFYLVTGVRPSVTFMKLAMVVCEGITIASLLKLLKLTGRPTERILIYAWCPLLVWEIAGSGHLDSAAMAFMALALLARFRRRPVATGIFLGIAVMMKLYPLVLLPALWWKDSSIRQSWRLPAALFAVMAIGYACYINVGMKVFGFLGGYAQEEGLDTGTRYFLLDLVRRVPALIRLPTAAYILFCGIVFSALSLWAWRRSLQSAESGANFLAPAFALAVALMLLFSPHYPWYIIWLVPFATLLPNLPVFTYLMAAFYLLTTELAMPGPKMFLLNEILYGATAVAFLLWLASRKLGWGKRYFV